MTEVRQQLQCTREGDVTLAVIILNFNGWSDTLRCLRSLRKSYTGNKIVFVIDNGSTDESVRMLGPSLLPGEVLITNSSNLGFTGGVNIGLAQSLGANARYILCLNNDTLLEEGVIEELIIHLEAHPDLAVCGPRVNLLSDPDRAQFARYSEITLPINDPWLSGCAFMLRSDIIKKIGFFDDNFFLFWEECDFWRRVLEAGYRVVYLPTEGKVLHRWGADARKLGGKGWYLNLRNEFLFKRRYQATLPTLFRILRRQVYEIAAARNNPLSRMRAILGGLRLWVQNPALKWDIERDLYGCLEEHEPRT